MNKTILLVEDDFDLLQNNKDFLQSHGYRALTAETLADADALFACEPVDLLLLDINMPDGSGLDFISEIHRKKNVPVIFLTGRTAKDDVIKGLTRGGCDYITKPFDYDILLARVEAQLRKASRLQVLTGGELTLDLLAGRAYFKSKDLQLSQKEYALLTIFLLDKEKILSKEYLYEKAWGQPMIGNSNALYTQLSLLKKKLEESSDGIITISTFRGLGYKLDIE